MHKILAATLLAATAGIALAGGAGTATADTTVTASYHARFCSDAKDGNNVAFQVNEGKPSDYGPWPDEPENTWHGQWMLNATFETWVGDLSYPYGTGMWCHTVVRTDLKEGDWVRLAGWNPVGSIATRLTEVVELDGVATKRVIGAEGWSAAVARCCAAAFVTIPALPTPDTVDPTPIDPTPPTSGSSVPSFGSS